MRQGLPGCETEGHHKHAQRSAHSQDSKPGPQLTRKGWDVARTTQVVCCDPLPQCWKQILRSLQRSPMLPKEPIQLVVLIEIFQQLPIERLRTPDPALVLRRLQRDLDASHFHTPVQSLAGAGAAVRPFR